MSIEGKLCKLMGYGHAILFPRARDALAAWCEVTKEKIKIPTNCCPALLPFASELVPIDPETGLAPVPVQLYGYRQEFPGAKIEIDPLMTGIMGKPFADSTVISFGYSKTIDIGGGGAILTSDAALAGELRCRAYFPNVLRQPLESALENIHAIIMEKKKEYEEIEAAICERVTRLQSRPVVPWRFVAKVGFSEPDLLDLVWYHQYKFSRNYPPLPGVTNPSAIEWGERVVNIWK